MMPALVVEDLGDGARQLVVQEALETNSAFRVSVLSFTPQTNMGVVVLGRSGHNHVFRTGFDVGLGFSFGEEEAGGFNHVFCAYCAPSDFCGVLAGGHADVLAVDDEFGSFEVVIHGAFELTVHCVVLEHVGHVVYGKKVVDGNNLNVVTLGGGAEDKATDTAKAIDTDFSHFGYFEYWV